MGANSEFLQHPAHVTNDRLQWHIESYAHPPMILSSIYDVAVLQRAVPVPGDARDDWKIVRAVSEVLGKPLPYDTLEVCRRQDFTCPFGLSACGLHSPSCNLC